MVYLKLVYTSKGGVRADTGMGYTNVDEHILEIS